MRSYEEDKVAFEYRQSKLAADPEALYIRIEELRGKRGTHLSPEASQQLENAICFLERYLAERHPDYFLSGFL